MLPCRKSNFFFPSVLKSRSFSLSLSFSSILHYATVREVEAAISFTVHRLNRLSDASPAPSLIYRGAEVEKRGREKERQRDDRAEWRGGGGRETKQRRKKEMSGIRRETHRASFDWTTRLVERAIRCIVRRERKRRSHSRFRAPREE